MFRAVNDAHAAGVSIVLGNRPPEFPGILYISTKYDSFVCLIPFFMCDSEISVAVCVIVFRCLGEGKLFG